MISEGFSLYIAAQDLMYFYVLQKISHDSEQCISSKVLPIFYTTGLVLQSHPSYNKVVRKRATTHE